MKNLSKIQELEKSIIKNKLLYYRGEPTISDEEYDSLEEKLRKLDPENNCLKIVGSDQGTGKKVKHKKKMLSLNKTYDLKTLADWKKDNDLISIYKVDGVSCSLVYKNGSLVLAKTRGDGSFGEDITEKARWIGSIPKAIDCLDEIEVRGEIFCEQKKFLRLSQEMESLNLAKPTSQRNIVAGLMGRKDKIELSRFLGFLAFELIGIDFKTEEEKLVFLKNKKFETPPFKLHKEMKTIETSITGTIDFLSTGNYLIDGLVFSFNNLDLHKELGETAHHPRYKMAFKFQGISKKTEIEDILWNVSRNGILTPIAKVKEVELSGAKITRVTLHNYGVVRQYELKQGDTIDIIRSGEVIPKFLKVLKSAEGTHTYPKKCPSCGEKIIIEDIRLFCKNSKCPAILKESLLNFIQKIGIEDLSSKRLEEMLDKKLIKSASDLFILAEEDFYKLDKVKEKLAKKLFNNIQSAKEVDLVTFLSALGISGGAYNKCEKVVFAGINTIAKIKKLSPEKLMEIDSFAEKSSTEFYNSLQEKLPLVEELISVGVKVKSAEVKSDSALAGKKICMTGTLSIGRSEMENKLRAIGLQIVTSISKNTDYLLTNDKESSSSKTKKAKTLGLSIINEKELDQLLSK